MSTVHPFPGATTTPHPAIDEAEIVATEFVLNHPCETLHLKIAVAVLAVLLAGSADFLAVFRIMQLKMLDPLGQPVGDTAGLVAMAGVTLIAFFTIGALAARRERYAKVAALVIYLLVLVLLGSAVAPSEISGVREIWDGIAGSAGFGSTSAAEAPSWFVIPCLFALTVAFSLFGVAFLLAKAWLTRLLALWQLRNRAEATLVQAKAARAQGEEARALAGFIATLETPEMADALRQAALRRGLDAYRAGVEDRAAAITAALADAGTAKAERQRLTELLADAGACLKSIPATL